jgi:4-hydroxy-tetrahydrodipicolinate synthase
MGLGIAAAGALGPRSGLAYAPAATGRVSKTERKQWAREYLKGMEPALQESYGPDLKTMDADGVRHDVRNSIKHGFSGVAVGGGRILEVVCDEAQGKIMVGAMVSGAVESAIKAMARAEALGCTHAILMGAGTTVPEKEDQLYADYRQIIDSTSLGIVLYGSPKAAFRQFHPTGLPFNTFDRLADLPNVVGMKITQTINPQVAYELCERLASRIILGPVNLDHALMMAKNYPNVQWSGDWSVESIQSPEKPYAVEFMDLLSKRRFNDAMKVYWQFQPALQAFWDLQAPLLMKGSHPWPHLKYCQWCVGGNGGITPQQPSDVLPVLDAKGRALIRDTYKKVGITPVDRPEEEFVVGKMNYAKGIRRSDLPPTPLYA